MKCRHQQQRRANKFGLVEYCNHTDAKKAKLTLTHISLTLTSHSMTSHDPIVVTFCPPGLRPQELMKDLSSFHDDLSTVTNVGGEGGRGCYGDNSGGIGGGVVVWVLLV